MPGRASRGRTPLGDQKLDESRMEAHASFLTERPWLPSFFAGTRPGAFRPGTIIALAAAGASRSAEASIARRVYTTSVAMTGLAYRTTGARNGAAVGTYAAALHAPTRQSTVFATIESPKCETAL